MINLQLNNQLRTGNLHAKVEVKEEVKQLPIKDKSKRNGES